MTKQIGNLAAGSATVCVVLLLLTNVYGNVGPILGYMFGTAIGFALAKEWI